MTSFGKYTFYILGAYGITYSILGFLLLSSLLTWRKRIQVYQKMEKDLQERKPRS